MSRRSSTRGCGAPLHACLLALAGCVAAPEIDAAPSAAGFELSAFDGRGDPVALDALPRRPRFVLSTPLTLPDAELMLITGRADAELWSDLSDLPLRAASKARAVAGASGASAGGLWFTPRATLASDANYSLVLPGSTKPRGGSALNQTGPAFLHELRTAADAAAGASVLATSPGDGSYGVPTNLRAAIVAFDGAVTMAEDAIWLETPDGLAVPAELGDAPCSGLHSSAFRCMELRPNGRLAPETQYVFRSGSALTDGAGAPLEAFSARFATAAGSDDTPPTFGAVECARDERPIATGCALVDDQSARVRVQLDEPATLGLRVADREHAQLWAAGDTRLRLDGLAGTETAALHVRATDLAGNTTEAREPLALERDLAQVSIMEIRANPRGPEPDQEYVEILNFGSVPVQLQGLALAGENERARGSLVSDSVVLLAGAHALLVADGFDPAQGAPNAQNARNAQNAQNVMDAVPPVGAQLVRVGASLTRGGLANSGEAIALRDARERRLSAAPPLPASGPGLCLHRRAADLRGDDAHMFAEGPCSPGR
jgi:hypothetical protein